jgi:hypothetical protein
MNLVCPRTYEKRRILLRKFLRNMKIVVENDAITVAPSVRASLASSVASLSQYREKEFDSLFFWAH